MELLHLVVQTDERDPLLKLADGNKPISFVVCNPPFFDAGEDPAESCMFGGGRRPKSSANSAAPFEVACEGGELSFVQRLYQESEQIGTKIKVYSVMLGRKSTFVALKRMLNERAEHVRFVHSELCQGRTIRHALAWTFDSTLALDQVPILRHKKSKAPLSLVVAADGRFKYMYHLAAIERELIQLLRNELQLPHVEIVGGGSDKRRIHIRSHVNTWSNQRRRRRQVQQEMTTNMSSMHIPDSPSTNDSQDRQSGDHQSPSSSSLDGLRMSDKRRRSSVELAESNSYIDVDPKEIELASNEWKSSKKPKVFATQLDFDATDRQMYLLHAEIIITMSDDVIRLSMRDLEFSCDSQSTYQLFQLIKNRI